jgi:hemolysin activation/secretion protein
MPPAESLKIDFILNVVILDGSTVYKPADLTPLYGDLIGKKVSLAQMFALRDVLTAKYRRDGYILSQVIVPPQKMTDGVIHMQAVEGYVANVTIQGDAHDSRGLITDMAERIKSARPLTAKVLERYVLLMQDVPGLSVRTVLRPAGNVPGAADLDLVVTHKTVTGYASVDNRGSKAIGPLQGQVGINLNSLFGRDDRTGLQLATVSPVDELQYAALQHDEILTPEGTRLSLGATYSRSKPRGALVNLDPLGNSRSFRAGIDYPVIRSPARTLRVGGAFMALNSSVDLLGTRFSDDKVRYLSLTASDDAADTLFGDSRPASTLVNFELSQGLDILGATRTGSPNLSVANGHSDFTRLNVDLTRNQTLSGRFGLGLAMAAQAATAPLLSAQRFGLGGTRIGRGYEPSEILGDSGIAGSIEARYNLPGNANFINPQVYLFYDIGKVWNKNPTVGQPQSQSLASAGPGVRFDLSHQVSANLELAKPLTRDIASRGNRDTRLLFSIISRF